MAVKNKIESDDVVEVVTFTKEQIVSAKRYIHRKDVLTMLLEEGQSYTHEEVDELIEKFMKEKVN
jgi:Ca2+-binding EF-hand superfamily protein